MQNAVGWFEIYVDDMERAKAFYQTVLGTTLEALRPPGDEAGLEMWNFPMHQEGGGAAGALCKMDGCPAGGGGTMVYFNCDDCADNAGRVAAAGGTVMKEKMSIGPYGFIAIAQDTEGNVFGLHSHK